MKTIIIEDEYPAAERLQRQIKKIDAKIEILAVLQSIESACEWLKNEESPDLIFSDIQLSDGLSFEIFDQISVKSPIIFTTSYDEYAIKAFKVKSIDYLLKPIKAIELERAIQKYKDFEHSFSKNEYALKIESLIDNLKPSHQKYKNRFLVKSQEQLIPVSQEEIAYFFTSNEMVCLVRKDDKQWLVDYTLEELENLLDPSLFFRLNRQLIANISSIGQINTYFNGKLKLSLQPIFSQEVLISREKAQAFKNWLEG